MNHFLYNAKIQPKSKKKLDHFLDLVYRNPEVWGPKAGPARRDYEIHHAWARMKGVRRTHKFTRIQLVVKPCAS